MTITRILVANRGEIARRVFRSARDMGISTVAVFSEGDADAPFVGDADMSVALGGRSAAESYLDGAKILDAARRSGADGIHPGYGFLSENATFAQSVVDAGIAWIGPPPSAIAQMGDKLSAKRMMLDASVPTLPSIEVAADTDVAAAADEIGYPVLVKASAGGGGKGMRIVNDQASLVDAIAGSKREAASSFGDDTVFLERYLPAPRHVEIQVLGDQHGTLLHLFERECSIQRRHQKVIEEAPSPALTPALRDQMGAAAVAAVEAIGYYSAGTVEFLLNGEGDDAEFFFLEVNTRLQVEHPVTEEITGLDLVREMIRIANGEPLGYGQGDLSITGHAIEARLYAEDPANGFLPATGTVEIWEPAAAPSARYDSGIESGSEVSVEFDPMLAKVIVHAPTRREAALRLALALERTRLAGTVTNRDFLVATLRTEEFLAGDTTTDFIDRVKIAGQREPSTGELHAAAVGVALRSQAINRSAAPQLAFMSSGYRNSSMPDEQMLLVAGDTELTTTYRRQRDGSFRVSVAGGEAMTAVIHGAAGDAVDFELDGMRSTMNVATVGDGWHVDTVTGSVSLTQLSPFPDTGNVAVAGGQVAPMPGKIIAVEVAVGDAVEAGQVLVLMEAMKMEHQITSPTAGTVTEVMVAVGEQVDNGALLVVVEAPE
ncbi:MAG: propionyl-CoA carboxylase alpha chain [Candidatus Poriferisodalaceae bacterium]|jgi:propionyl-CoA carboxylase alpha chain